jgi:hypothetical protein
MVTLNNILAVILLLVFDRTSDIPARIDKVSGHPILLYGLNHRVIYLVIGLQIPLSVILFVTPRIENVTIYLIVLLFVFIVMPFFWGITSFIRSFRYSIELTNEDIIIHQANK